MSQVERRPTWLVLRTYNRKEMEISSFLQQNGLRHFIPMTWQERHVKDGEKPQRVLVPIIHNYVFLEKTLDEERLMSLLSQCRVPLHVMKDKASGRFSEIPEREMSEFRLICDPEYATTPKEFIVGDDAEALPGKEVIVVHGPFAGVRGKLHKKNQKYWFVKTVGGVSVMLRISRWYCKVMN